MATSRGEAIAETALQLIFHADNLTTDKISAIAADIRRLGASIKVETDRVKAFKIDVRWRSRVINVPIAVDNFKQLLSELTTGLREKLQTIERPFLDFKETVKLLAAPPSDPGVSKLASSFSEVENFIAALNVLVGDLATAIQDSLSLTALFDRVLQDIQHLDDLFLSQKSTRTKTTATYYKRNA